MSIEKAIQSFESGKLVAIPTETVYGLAAPVDNLALLKKIFLLKERPFFDPLIVHVSSIEMAKEYCAHWNDDAQKLAEKFWPGPLTLVLPKKSEKVDDLITSGLDTVGIRSPRNTSTLSLIEKLQCGLAAPSANKFTKISPTKPEHVQEYFSEADVYVLEDAGGEVGIESTILSLDSKTPTLLRPGSISAVQIEEVLGSRITRKNLNNRVPSAPGQLHVHYRPKTPLVVTTRTLTNEDRERIRETLDCDVSLSYELHLESEPQMVARELYLKLREIPSSDNVFNFIDLSNRELTPEWDGILDRLKKAATLFFMR